ncbi:MAG: hypothetical protein GY715_17500 [Planctomycetes bacterium]|nr:hypothetical protein [Planctomycetota bacterium]
MEVLLEAVSDKLIFVVIGFCFVVGMVMKAITTIVTGQAREKSRREIAAYIAEGTMDPAQGERLLKADVSAGRNACG